MYNRTYYKEDIDIWEDSVTRSQPGGVCHNLLHNKLTTLIYNQQFITALVSTIYTITIRNFSSY